MKNLSIALFFLFSFSICVVAESCEKNKHACGTKHQKKQRNHRIKKGTNFMTY